MNYKINEHRSSRVAGKVIATQLIFMALFICQNVNAQTEITLPKFEGETVVLRTLEATGYFDPTLSISDGGKQQFSMPLKKLKEVNEIPNALTLAIIINNLKKQGYKLISSHSGGLSGNNFTVASTYIFQKD